MRYVTRERRTERLKLRPLQAEAIDWVTTLHSDGDTNRHRSGGPPTPRRAEEIAEEFVRGWEEDGIGYWAVEHEGAVVGVAGIRPFDLGDLCCWNLYYRFAPAGWGRGFAAEAAREAIAQARELERHRPVIARTRPTNALAIRVAEAAGLKRRPDLDRDGFVVLCTP
jgi:RimJ/RimL family protein N-acetyltransferase